MKRKFSEAFYSGLNLNYTPDLSREVQFEDPRIKKLRYWIDKAKHSDLSKKVRLNI